MIPLNEYGYPTSRTFSRSLSEDFPDERAKSIEGPDNPQSLADTVVAVALWFAGTGVAVLLAYEYMKAIV